MAMRSQILPYLSPSYKMRAAALPFAPAVRAPARFDFDPENEHFVARLGRRTQGWRQGWVAEYRFATGVGARTVQQVFPTCEPQLQDAGRGAPPKTGDAVGAIRQSGRCPRGRLQCAYVTR